MAGIFTDWGEAARTQLRTATDLEQLKAAAIEATRNGWLEPADYLTTQVTMLVARYDAYRATTYPVASSAVEELQAIQTLAWEFSKQLSALIKQRGGPDKGLSVGEPAHIAAAQAALFWKLCLLGGGAYLVYRFFFAEDRLIIPWEKLPHYAGGGRA